MTLRPIPEYRAEGELRRRYEDMKSVLQVPWMGVVSMAYAYYQNFYATLWEGLRPLCESQPFVAACQDLRSFTEIHVAALSPSPITGRLSAAGYSPREIDDIRAIIEVFSHGNFPYLLLATLTRHLVEGGEIGGVGPVELFVGHHAPTVHPPFVLMEPHHAEPSIQALYEEVKVRLGLPFVNTDYRALARWPSYFGLAWGDLKPWIGTRAHDAIAQKIHERALVLANALPNPGGLTSRALQAAAQRDAPHVEICEMARLFQWLLPGLVANIAFFRSQLHS
ncbi:hypothetical protein [Bradyrhizobium sp.]|uniref:hypothetical protein n=1 Tax=Bradyrhizobium sp. TaxID=376 RepID=UPI00238F01C9|nr:hypothetical protein [Bradyrhizobium sp.]MDE1935988.1 hypothetical protein [Bradyrhizobium sp.]